MCILPVVPKDPDVNPLAFDFHQNLMPQFIIEINVNLCTFIYIIV
jgi:hypothetical protein